ncbi:hypothetical protein CsatB_014644 [Cannabis sativa]
MVDLSLESCAATQSVAFIDPKNKPIENEIRNCVTTALETYMTQQNIRKRAEIKIRQYRCRGQPDDQQCGYYCMKIIKSFMTQYNPATFLKDKFKDDKPYNNQEINEIRDEWADFVNSKFSLYIFICLTVTFSFSWFPSLILFLRSDQLRLNYAGPRLLEPSITITSDGNQAEGSAIVDDKKRENDDREAMEVGMGKIAISSDSKPVKDASSSVKPSMPAAATSSCGEPTQRWYHVPRSWFKSSGNILVIFDEKGGDPSKITLSRRKVTGLCALVAEDHPSIRPEAWEKEDSGSNRNVPTVHLQCPENTLVSAVKFASFGTPSGNCGSYTKGDCHDPNSILVVEKVRTASIPFLYILSSVNSGILESLSLKVQ